MREQSAHACIHMQTAVWLWDVCLQENGELFFQMSIILAGIKRDPAFNFSTKYLWALVHWIYSAATAQRICAHNQPYWSSKFSYSEIPTLVTPTPVKRASSSSCLRGSRPKAWLWSPSIISGKRDTDIKWNKLLLTSPCKIAVSLCEWTQTRKFPTLFNDEYHSTASWNNMNL